MPAQLPSSSGCCTCGTSPTVVNIPGPTGPAGSNGTNGSNGVNAYCTTTAQFTVPNVSFTVVVSVDSTSFLPSSPGGAYLEVYIGNAGYFEVISFTSNSITCKNVQAVPGTTVIALGQKVSIAGPRGTTGAAGGGAPSTSTYLIQTADGSLPNAQVLGSLSSGYAKVTTTTGAVTTVTTIPTSDLSGTLTAPKGGTGQSTFAIGDLLSASSTSALAKLSVGTVTYPICSNGVGVQASYQQLNLGSAVTGVLPITNGGTGSTTAAGARTSLGLANAFNPQYLSVYFATLESGWTVPIVSGGGLGAVIFVATNQFSTTIGFQTEAAFGSNGAYTPTTTGYYVIQVSLYVRPNSLTRTYTAQVLKNSAVTGITGRITTTSAQSVTLSFGGIVQITNANSDSIQVAIYADSSSANSVFEQGSRVTITKISA